MTKTKKKRSKNILDQMKIHAEKVILQTARVNNIGYPKPKYIKVRPPRIANLKGK